MKTSRQMLDEAWASVHAPRPVEATVTFSQYGLAGETLAAYEDRMLDELYTARPLLWTLDGIHYTRDKQ